ncbi:MAG: hypothetical protein ACKV0T_00955 [Planctomycetales bacterium]
MHSDTDCRAALRWSRSLAGAALVLCIFPAAAAPQGRPPSPVSDEQIKTSIQRGVAYLLQDLTNNHDTGHAAVATLALLKAEVSPNTPVIKTALDRMAARFDSSGKFVPGTHHFYDAGVTLMALGTADPEKYRKQMEAIATYLIDGQGQEGDWDYPHAKSGGDTSISQYAILGLWEASRAGIKVPQAVWSKAAGWHISRQRQDGGFTYHPLREGDPGANGAMLNSTHSMTAAGTASLLVTRLYLGGKGALPPDVTDEGTTGRRRSRGKKFGLLTPAVADADPEDSPERDAAPADTSSKPVSAARLAGIGKAITRGRAWLTERFTVDPRAEYKTYYLYGLERLSALLGVTEFDGHDWYAEGAAFLVTSQFENGSWSDYSASTAATSFALMFLVKATEKTLNRPKRPNTRFGGGLLVGGRGLPTNLQEVQIDKGSVKVRKLKGPVDELLAELENVQSQNVESAQAGLVETVLTEDPESLIGQKDRLSKLAADRRPEVRRTVYWALGRTSDLTVAPILIAGLEDNDLSCMIEARNALRFLSKRVNAVDLPDEPTDQQRAQAIAQWKKWYQSIRPYDERDDLGEAAKP